MVLSPSSSCQPSILNLIMLVSFSTVYSFCSSKQLETRLSALRWRTPWSSVHYENSPKKSPFSSKLTWHTSSSESSSITITFAHSCSFSITVLWAWWTSTRAKKTIKFKSITQPYGKSPHLFYFSCLPSSLTDNSHKSRLFNLSYWLLISCWLSKSRCYW